MIQITYTSTTTDYIDEEEIAKDFLDNDYTQEDIYTALSEFIYEWLNKELGTDFGFGDDEINRNNFEELYNAVAELVKVYSQD